MPSVDFLAARDQLVATSVLFGSITRIFCFRSKLKCKTNPRQRGFAFATEGLCFTVVVVEQSSSQTHETFPAAEDFGHELGSGLGPVVVTTLKE